MPFALIIIGIVLLVAGVRNTVTVTADKSPGLYPLVKNDLAGFTQWFLAILIIGGLGYIPQLKNLSRVFLTLVIIVLLIKTDQKGSSNGGFFTNFFKSIKL